LFSVGFGKTLQTLETNTMKRREMLKATGLALAGAALPMRWLAAAERKKEKVLYFTRSAGFEHSVVRRPEGQLSHSERIMVELGEKHGVEVVCSKDGTLFDGDLDQYATIAFYTSGNLLGGAQDGSQPMTAKGKQRLLDWVSAGGGFVGIHAATDTFRSGGVDPYIEMIGGEFSGHGPQQVAKNTNVSPEFPGMEDVGKSFELLEEWYAFRKLNTDMHVTLVLQTEGMQGNDYQRPPFPSAWARNHGDGRVYYNSLGHREDVWTNPLFQGMLLGGFSWTMRQVDFDPVTNFDKVTPKGNI
jgi:uncharacterized protein